MALTTAQYEMARRRTFDYFTRAGIVLTEQEKRNIEVTDFGLEDLDTFGLELITYVNTTRCCAKELVLFPGQTCAEHRHPPVGARVGKEETFRCRWGEVYLYVEGEPTEPIAARLPAGQEEHFTARHEVILRPGEQYTLAPNVWHWFQGGPAGAVVSEFSTTSTDEADLFTDSRVRRIPEFR